MAQTKLIETDDRTHWLLTCPGCEQSVRVIKNPTEQDIIDAVLVHEPDCHLFQYLTVTYHDNWPTYTVN